MILLFHDSTSHEMLFFHINVRVRPSLMSKFPIRFYRCVRVRPFLMSKFPFHFYRCVRGPPPYRIHALCQSKFTPRTIHSIHCFLSPTVLVYNSVSRSRPFQCDRLPLPSQNDSKPIPTCFRSTTVQPVTVYSTLLRCFCACLYPCARVISPCLLLSSRLLSHPFSSCIDLAVYVLALISSSLMLSWVVRLGEVWLLEKP